MPSEPLTITLTIPPMLAEKVRAIQKTMADHCTDGQPMEGAIVRLVSIGAETWEKAQKEDR